RTGSRGIGRRHSYYSPTGACCLEGEDAQELRPSRVADALSEVVVLDHIGRPQVPVIERIIRAHQLECCLVVKVLTLALHRLVRLGKRVHRLAPPMAAFLPPRYAPLHAFQMTLGLAIATQGMDHRAV